MISPFSFGELDRLEMPYEQGMLVMVRGDPPFVHTQPGGGDVGCYVADAAEAVWIRR